MHNEKGEEVPTRLTTGWRVCIDYRRLNEVTRKDHFSLPFMDQLLERISGHPMERMGGRKVSKMNWNENERRGGEGGGGGGGEV